MKLVDMPSEPRVTEMAWPTKIVFGVGALQRLPAQVARLGMKKPLVVTDAGVVKAGLAQRVYDVLGGADIVYGVFDRV
jgi:4-hydroxybutyrate dehydrogenase